MRHRVKGRFLGRDASHRKALYRNLITELLRRERITTTEAKAKAIKGEAESLIAMACRSLEGPSEAKLHARREAMRTLTDKAVMFKLFDEMAEGLAGRPGGYTRIVKIGPRRGDGAPMVVLELVD